MFLQEAKLLAINCQTRWFWDIAWIVFDAALQQSREAVICFGDADGVCTVIESGSMGFWLMREMYILTQVKWLRFGIVEDYHLLAEFSVIRQHSPVVCLLTIFMFIRSDSVTVDKSVLFVVAWQVQNTT